MPGFLLDTNVLSEFSRRGEPDRRVKNWLDAVDKQYLFISAVTLGEVRFGIDLLSDGRRRTQLESWLDRDLQYWFDGRILPIDQSIAGRWGSVRASAQRNGRTLPIVDSLIAATALHHELTIVSRNEADFAASGLVVLNPWTS